MSIEFDIIKEALDECDPVWKVSFTTLREAATFWQLDDLWYEVFDEALSDKTTLHPVLNLGRAYEAMEEFGVEYDD